MQPSCGISCFRQTALHILIKLQLSLPKERFRLNEEGEGEAVMKYSNTELCEMVDEFRALDAEPSWLEFKTGMKDPVQIAKYISGLSNVAAYAGNTHGYLYPAGKIAEKTNRVEDYLEAKAYDDAFYMQRVLEFMCAKGRVTRKQINGLLLRHMSGMMDEKQKLTKIGNLLSLKLKKRLGWIVSDGSTSGAYWSLTNKGREACRKGSPSCKKRCAKL